MVVTYSKGFRSGQVSLLRTMMVRKPKRLSKWPGIPPKGYNGQEASEIDQAQAQMLLMQLMRIMCGKRPATLEVQSYLSKALMPSPSHECPFTKQKVEDFNNANHQLGPLHTKNDVNCNNAS